MLAPRSYLFLQSQNARNERPSMAKRKTPAKGEKKPVSPATVSKTAPPPPAEPLPRPTTPSSPVVIPPSRGKDTTQRSQASKSNRNGGGSRKHSPDAVSPSVAALLAMTQIPSQKQSIRRKNSSRQRLTVDSIYQQASEKELSLSLGKSPLEYLLSSPEELQDELATIENGYESVVSTRTVSCESVPSLTDASIGDTSPSVRSLSTPGSRGRRSTPPRRIFSSPPAESAVDDHPLSSPVLDIEQLDFRVFQKPKVKEPASNKVEADLASRKSAFKSNLTASLRALRSAAKSFSYLTTPMIAPDDFLTRSILTIDPSVPFTDERMPPRLEDTPTPALRRYLNHATNAPIEANVPSSLTQTMSATKCTASIQMETYNVSRSGKGAMTTSITRRSQPMEGDLAEVAGPIVRQREIRENSDFLRIAVMEMAMRKKGKLDDQKPGRAIWALPPRLPTPNKTYERNREGVPLRWVALVQD